MPLKTPLYEEHCQAGAKLVEFSGWEMPIHYGSQLEEHEQVRASAGMFDVSHMGVVDMVGREAYDFLRYLLANDVAKLKSVGDALYTCMLNTQGGVIDDLIVYRIAEDQYRVVVNAGRREQDLTWIRKLSSGFTVEINEREDLCILAVQGPQAIAMVSSVLGESWAAKIVVLKPFRAAITKHMMIGRTGYTGEDGVEIILSAQAAIKLWQSLLSQHVKPCGLGARDTLRLEAGLNLYGADMNEQTSPLVSNLAWTVSWEAPDRDFVGRTALLYQKQHGIEQKLIGLVMQQPGVLRAHQSVKVDDNGEGEITSGGYSPTLGCGIALARIPVSDAMTARVVRRGEEVPVQIVVPPFVRYGKKLI